MKTTNHELRTKHYKLEKKMTIRRFEDIEGWQLARQLAKEVYTIANSEGFRKDWGLKDQITRASGSVMHNIAEGLDFGTNKEFAWFLSYAQRSCAEVESQLYVVLDQNYISSSTFENIYNWLNKRNKRSVDL